MIKRLPIYALVIAMACQSKEQTSQALDTVKAITVDSVKLKNAQLVSEDTIVIHGVYERSSYDEDDAGGLTMHRENLRKLDSLNVFSKLHNDLVVTLSDNHLNYFKNTPHYQLIAFANGNLFQNNEEDFAFVVYDNKSNRISILTYNYSTHEYLELYREIKVVNGLNDAGCNYGHSGTLDYQLADETLIYPMEYLVKNVETYYENPVCKITDIGKDETFALASGCFAKGASKTVLVNSLCITTSSVYNNWECLRYDKATKAFIIFYGASVC
jgi:hypothetical protein